MMQGQEPRPVGCLLGLLSCYHCHFFIVIRVSRIRCVKKGITRGIFFPLTSEGILMFWIQCRKLEGQSFSIHVVPDVLVGWKKSSAYNQLSRKWPPLVHDKVVAYRRWLEYRTYGYLAYSHIRESESYFNRIQLLFMRNVSGYFLLKYAGHLSLSHSAFFELWFS